MDGLDRLSALRQALRNRLGPQRYELWLGDETSLAVEDGSLRVRCGSAAEMKWLRRRMDAVFADVCVQLWDDPIAIVYEVSAAGNGLELSPTDRPRRDAAKTGAAVRRTSKMGRQPATMFDEPEPSNVVPAPSATASVHAAQFGDFVVGPSNLMAVEAVRHICVRPGRFSPLLVTGPSGSGKTRLITAGVQAARSDGSRRRVLQFSAEQFTSMFVEALQRRDLPGLRNKVRSVDFLAIDDVQFLLGKRATLAELIYTIDAVGGHGGQIVLAADRTASQLQAASPELATRVSSGLVTALEPPDSTVRRGIVRLLAARQNLNLEDELIEYISQQVVGSGRLLSGAVNRLAAASAAAGTTISLEFAESELAEFCKQHLRQVRLVDIQKAVCDVCCVEPAALKSACKQRSVAEPRMLAMWLARRFTRAALSEIGDFFGRRSHSTVLSAQRKCDDLLSRRGEIRVGDRACRLEDALGRIEAALRTG